jgi:hypothetical protein
MTLDVEDTTRRGEDKAPSSLGNNRGTLVPPALNQHIKNFALGIDAAPQIDHAAIDLEIDLVQMLGRVGLGSADSRGFAFSRVGLLLPSDVFLVFSASSLLPSEAGSSRAGRWPGKIRRAPRRG